MARYKIWNKTENVITPIGEVLTPQEWINRYPMADVLDIIIGGGKINGSVCMVYDDTIEMYEKMGVDFSECETQQDHLDAIEAWEDAQSVPVATVSDQTRIADALEDLVVLSMDDVVTE